MSKPKQICIQLHMLFVILLTFPTAQLAFSAHPTAQDNMIRVRFSLYPNVAKEVPPSMKEAVKTAVGRLGDLGISIHPDDVSTVLTGTESALFEAIRTCFGRACITADGKHPRGVSLQATFSSHGVDDDDDDHDHYSTIERPVRTAVVENGMEFVRDAYLQPPRIAAQFALYPMGTISYLRTVQMVKDNAMRYSCWKHNVGKFGVMLDGDGNEVFDVLRESFALGQSETETVEMTLTVTANKNAWPEQDWSQTIH